MDNWQVFNKIQKYTVKIQKLNMAFMYLFLTSLVTTGVYYIKINSSNGHSYNVRTFAHDIGF